MNAMRCWRNALAVVAGANLATIAAAELACYQINETQECEQVPANDPLECEKTDWIRFGPDWESYVARKTLLLTPGSSGKTCETRKCRRVYRLVKVGQEDQLCYSEGYGVNRSFIKKDCVVGSGGGDT
jgi:hypothetical protein